jgi:hypothetical protein
MNTSTILYKILFTLLTFSIVLGTRNETKDSDGSSDIPEFEYVVNECHAEDFANEILNTPFGPEMAPYLDYDFFEEKLWNANVSEYHG